MTDWIRSGVMFSWWTHFPWSNKHMHMFVERIPTGGYDVRWWWYSAECWRPGNFRTPMIHCTLLVTGTHWTEHRHRRISFQIWRMEKGDEHSEKWRSSNKPAPRIHHNELTSSQCGKPKHTRETCFKLNGYPDWWDEFKARKQRDTTISGTSGLAVLDHAEPHLSLISHTEFSTSSTIVSSAPSHGLGKFGYFLFSSIHGVSNGWILDSGSTDHMTNDPTDLISTTHPWWENIANAKGVTYPVTGTGTFFLSKSLSLSNTLLVPSPSSKLFSVGQATEDLNCCVLIYPKFCLLQHILTKEIIGRGTKREGLYYMDDFSEGRAHQVWLVLDVTHRRILQLHCRLGHPSFSYMKHLLPHLFLNVAESDFKWETCILANSHCVRFPMSLTTNYVPFTLVHSDFWGPSLIPTSFGVW